MIKEEKEKRAKMIWLLKQMCCLLFFTLWLGLGQSFKHERALKE